VGEHAGSWEALVLLGAFHGINPAMGWLFAVALGLQEHRRQAVWRALLPLGLGHALAIAVAIIVAVVLGIALPPHLLRWAVAMALAALGLRFLFRHPHPRWAAMRVSMADLTLWSFLVGTVHGAGLMVAPVFLGMTDNALLHAHLPARSAGVVFLATTVHAASYLIVTGSIAFLVFEKLGVNFLRKAWLNIDLIWAVALIVTGIANLMI
jgi:putative Ca2+/H+ antiporter (TMEM165/GDT1 family)